ncbi:MAG: divalent-cation tolerance protein CutA [Deltaproteobacteria bacterium]|nr:divalent-cation tolerance protein CutA [Deltaproteobacteria bacterium]
METRIVLVTTPSEEIASQIATTLVTETLAACVNIVPNIRSIYSWQGKIEDEKECLMLIKTTLNKITDLEHRLHEIHPYETPEFIALLPDAISKGYESWLLSTLK